MNATQALHAQIQALLNRMELLSEAATARMDVSTGHTKPGAKLLAHNGPPMHDVWFHKFAAAYHDQRELERLLAAGKAALALRKHGPPKLHGSVDSENFILTNYEGVDCETVAGIESERGAYCHPEYVRWLRRRNDYSDQGYPVKPSDGRVRLAVQLYEEIGNQTKVAIRLGVSQTTVSRLLDQGKKAA